MDAPETNAKVRRLIDNISFINLAGYILWFVARHSGNRIVFGAFMACLFFALGLLVTAIFRYCRIPDKRANNKILRGIILQSLLIALMVVMAVMMW